MNGSHRFRLLVLALLLALLAGLPALLPVPAQAAAATPAPAPVVDANPTDDPAAIALVAWNVGLDDADAAYIGARMAAFEDVDLWALAEVNSARAVPLLEAAAEEGEGADFAAVLGVSGGGHRLLALYDAERFTLVDRYELDAINTTGTVRAPLVLQLRDRQTGAEFLFMVNHLYRSRDAERHKQAELLAAWAAAQTLPVVAAGDYNFDWDDDRGEADHDRGYDLLTAGGVWEWVRPAALVPTQCSGWPCRYDDVLDFVFTAGPAQAWGAESEIVVAAGDFPDDREKSDHRPVLARLWPAGPAAAAGAAGALPTAPLVPAQANANSNLRRGPGTNYARVTTVAAGTPLEVVGRNAAGDWYRLADGAWIAAFLVDGAPAGLPVVEETVLSAATATPATPARPAAPTPTALPAATAPPTPVPTATPQPTAAPVAAAGPGALVIVRVDKRDEYVDIRNTGAAAVDLAGWHLLSERGSQDCPLRGAIQAGETLRIWAMQGEGGFSCGFGSNIWNNSQSDPAALIAPDGTVVSRY